MIVQTLMRVVLLAVMCGVLWAQVRMNVDQLRAFITSSTRLGHTDKQISDYIKNIRMIERLDEATVEDFAAGPRTTEALRRLITISKDLPAPKPPAPKPVVQPIPPPDPAEQARVLEAAREYARDYSKKLPNFICTQVTRRYEDPSGLEFWQSQDTVVEKLSFFEQKEDYKLLFVNNKAFTGQTRERIGGTVTRGEFGTRLKETFDPKSAADFEWERWATLRGKRMHVFRYSIDQDRSEYSVAYGNTVIIPGYTGLVYIDRETLAVMRITLEVRKTPSNFAISHILAVLDYDFTKVGSQEYVLPLKASTVARMGRALFKNDVEFRNYNRFGAEATITFAPDPLPEDQLQEEPAKP
ncbi:MAG TPA: hypothetical protein VER03_08390 [Bryobacteraceae bacterium]|nr:hypothetical protein [Bryobacteraceae bacterium]